MRHLIPRQVAGCSRGLLLMALLLLGACVHTAPMAPPSAFESATASAPASVQPIVIAHRGASGHRPEHTLAAYALAIAQGADFIEADLVATADGALVARHENDISGTTDVADHPGFAARRTTKRIEGVDVTGWFTEDFTLDELLTLRARERIPAVRPASARFDGTQGIPTLAEIIALVREAESAGRTVGLYLETKHPTFFATEGRRLAGGAIGIDLGERLVDTLVAEGFTDPDRVFIQSFEVANLVGLQRGTMPRAGVAFPLVQLTSGATDAPYDLVRAVAAGDDLDVRYPGLRRALGTGHDGGIGYGDLACPRALAWMRATYARGIGPATSQLLPRVAIDPPAADGVRARLTGEVHPLLADARAAGLLVHPYTLRAEPPFLARTPDGDVEQVGDEALRLFRLGVDGIFIDQPDLGVAARDRFVGDVLR